MHQSVQLSRSVVSNSLQPHGLQHARPPYPSPTPGVYSNLCPLSQWCHPTISSSFVPFSSRLEPFPASGSFPVSQLFTSGGQSIGVSASTLVLPNILAQDSFSNLHLCVLVVQLFPTFCDPWTAAHQAPLCMGFSRREHWSGLPFPPPGDLPDPGIEPGSPALKMDALQSELLGKPQPPSSVI